MCLTNGWALICSDQRLPPPDWWGSLKKTLKLFVSLNCKFIHEDECNLNHWLDPLFFAGHELPQASTAFSPFEILFGRKVQGVLDLMKDNWAQSPAKN